MGAMSNDPFTLARYAGFYKGLQSAGAAVSFGVDAVATPVRPSPTHAHHPLLTGALEWDVMIKRNST